MSSFDLADGIAVVLLVVYIIALPFSLYVSFRHGLGRSSGWIFLAIFCVLRIVSSSAQLATISEGSDGTAETIASITQSIGLSPLLLASLGFVSRVYNTLLKTPYNMIFTLYAVRLIQIPATVALILCIVGATSSNNPEDIFNQGTLKAGIIIFAVIVIILSILILVAVIMQRRTRRSEEALIKALAWSLPLLIIVIMYSVAECFGSHKPGSVLVSETGSRLLHLFLADIEEAIVTAIYISTGFRLESVPTPPQDEENTGVPLSERNQYHRVAHRAQRGDFRGGRLGLVSLLIELVSGFIESTRSDNVHTRK